MPSTARHGSLVDPASLMSIRNLELRARLVVEGFWSGLHRSPYHGFSVEFTEYRQYTPGDDPRHVDWRVFARSDRFYIKKYEDETNLRCHLLVDQSRSMTFGRQGWTKAEYAATLAATLAHFLYLQGDAVGLLTFDESIREYLPARQRSGHLRQLMLALGKPPGGRGTNLTPALRRITELIRKRGLIVVVSDFLAPIGALESELMALSAAGHEVLVFQILDRAELDFDFDQSATFEDLETGRTLMLDPRAARESYLRQLNAHTARLRSACQRLGIGFNVLGTDRPLELALFDFLRERMQSGRRVRRAAGRARRRAA